MAFDAKGSHDSFHLKRVKSKVQTGNAFFGCKQIITQSYLMYPTLYCQCLYFGSQRYLGNRFEVDLFFGGGDV